MRPVPSLEPVEPSADAALSPQPLGDVEKQFGTFLVEAACDEVRLSLSLPLSLNPPAGTDAFSPLHVPQSCSSDSEPVSEPSSASNSSSDSDSSSESDSSSTSSSEGWRTAAARHAGLHRSLVDTCAAALSAEADLAQATSWLERCTEDARAAQGRLES